MAYQFLDEMYDCLVKHVKPKSTLLADLISKKNTNLWKLLDKVKTPTSKLKDLRMELNDALDLGYILEDATSIYITAKGIHAVEKERGRFNIDEFIDFLDTKYFDVLGQKNKPLADNKKTAVFFLISIRAFSRESCLDLNRAAADLDAMWAYVVSCADFLYEMGTVGDHLAIHKIGSKKGDSEHLIFNLLRHAVDVQMATDCIFQFPGESTYYLDVFANGAIDLNKLAFLFHKIFANELSAADIDKISQFCNKLAKESMFIMFRDINRHIFRELSYNGTIADALNEYNRKFF